MNLGLEADHVVWNAALSAVVYELPQLVTSSAEICGFASPAGAVALPPYEFNTGAGISRL